MLGRGRQEQSGEDGQRGGGGPGEGSDGRPRGAADRETRAVHAWRVTRLAALGLAMPVAEAVADRVDWHEVAKLTRSGCPIGLAIMIVD
ncbi:MAG TPA: hypothetical protein VGG25_28235 [Streptosporangiaceae bacterium]